MISITKTSTIVYGCYIIVFLAVFVWALFIFSKVSTKGKDKNAINIL